jgi:hypothetical protein
MKVITCWQFAFRQNSVGVMITVLSGISLEHAKSVQIMQTNPFNDGQNEK